MEMKLHRIDLYFNYPLSCETVERTSVSLCVSLVHERVSVHSLMHVYNEACITPRP